MKQASPIPCILLLWIYQAKQTSHAEQTQKTQPYHMRSRHRHSRQIINTQHALGIGHRVLSNVGGSDHQGDAHQALPCYPFYVRGRARVRLHSAQMLCCSSPLLMLVAWASGYTCGCKVFGPHPSRPSASSFGSFGHHDYWQLLVAKPQHPI